MKRTLALTTAVVGSLAPLILVGLLAAPAAQAAPTVAPLPVITGISPDTGPYAGGFNVTITGTNLSPSGIVYVGYTSVPVDSSLVQVANATTIQLTMPSCIAAYPATGTPINGLTPCSTAMTPVAIQVATPVGTNAITCAATFYYGTGRTPKCAGSHSQKPGRGNGRGKHPGGRHQAW